MPLEQNLSKDKGFHITVGAPSWQSPKLDVKHDMRLLKAALLYADRVKYCSLSSQMLIGIMQLRSLSETEMLKLFAPAMQQPDLENEILAYELLKKKRNSNNFRQYRAEYVRLETLIRKSLKEIKQQLGMMAIDAGVASLNSALVTGLIEVQMFEGKNGGELVDSYFQTISRLDFEHGGQKDEAE